MRHDATVLKHNKKSKPCARRTTDRDPVSDIPGKKKETDREVKNEKCKSVTVVILRGPRSCQKFPIIFFSQNGF